MKSKKRVGAGSGVRIKRVSIRRVIADIGACYDARVWMNGFPADRAIDYWNNCSEPAWMSWLIWKLTGCIRLRSSNYDMAVYTPLSTTLACRADKVYKTWLRRNAPYSTINSKRKVCAQLRSIIPWSKVELALFELGGGRLPKGYKHV